MSFQINRKHVRVHNEAMMKGDKRSKLSSPPHQRAALRSIILTRTGGDYEEAAQKKSRPPSSKSITSFRCELPPVFEYFNSEMPMS